RRRVGSKVTAPPPSSTTAGSARARTSAAASSSSARNAASPLSAKIASIAVPTRSSTTASRLTNSRPSLSATTGPSVDLPAPMNPTSARWRSRAFSGATCRRSARGTTGARRACPRARRLRTSPSPPAPAPLPGVRPGTRRNPRGDPPADAAERVTIGASRIRRLAHALVAGGAADLDRPPGDHDSQLGQQCLRDRAGGDVDGGVPRARALERIAHVFMPVFQDTGQVRVTGPREGDGLGAFPLGLALGWPWAHAPLPVLVIEVADDERERRTERQPVA